ncbi:hypothetical protein [Marinobacter sp. C2H3]|uniref:hypothetical protein n=1 Tax=Marinobacter sp. C2H3 TaxID=3119003 RepID=UPI00300ECA8D
MRADGRTSAPELRSLMACLSLFTLVLLAGCKTEKSPDQPTLLGEPGTTAYLGVKYFYNWGAYGGESILDYTLTNAPSWLALEDTNNKARQGIIMTGVPGLTGGARGDADIGKVRNINLVTTDGRMAGAQPFDIDVKYNALALESETFTEGEPSEAPPDTARERCAVPDLSARGKHTFTINTYDDSGAVTGTQDITEETRQVAVKLTLDQPSVTQVQVAFQLESDYNPERCDPSYTGTPPHQRCDQSAANASDAIIGQDIVGLGSGSPEPEDIDGKPLGYLRYTADDNGNKTGGLITLEPGVQECYIRLEVVDDTFAELSEAATLVLTEVRSGLAGLGPNNGGAETRLVIDDNEPTVSLSTKKGGHRDTLNVGDVREYTATLSAASDRVIHARLTNSEDSSARIDTDFVVQQKNASDVWVTDPELVFDKGQTQKTFRIAIPDAGTYNNPDLPDRFIDLTLDSSYQAGRTGYARPAMDSLLRVSINELTTPLALGSDTGFVPTDVTLGQGSRVFVAGYDVTDGNRVGVRIYDQKGGLLQTINVTPSTDTITTADITAAPPVIRTVTREVSEGTSTVNRYEFVVAYGTSGPLTCAITDNGSGPLLAIIPPGCDHNFRSNPIGGIDVLTSVYWYDSAAGVEEYKPLWTLRTGSTGDDLVRAAAISENSGYVFVAGETNGVFPGESSAGGVDSFAQRVDRTQDGASETPVLTWTQQVGSVGKDTVAGGDVSGLSPTVFGQGKGSVGGGAVVGGIDGYFYQPSASGAPTVRQVGSGEDDLISAGLVLGGNVWLLGNANAVYAKVVASDDTVSLDRTSLSSQAGFLLLYGNDGTLQNAITLNDGSDNSTETFGSVIRFDGDLVVAGDTTGSFDGTLSGNNAIASRVSLVPDAKDGETVFQNNWRWQSDIAGSQITALANYRDDEIVALSHENTVWKLRLLSPEGLLLTPGS